MKRMSLLLITGLMAIMLSGCKWNNTISKDTSTEATSPIETDTSYIVDWSDITVSGLDENAFIQKLDTELLQDVAAKLQSLVDEELAEEDENPGIILSEGFVRVFKKELYLEVIDMGDKAEMPLYYILYKSPNNEMYEYICAVALSELTGLDFMNESGDYYDWASGKEYLELFNAYMIDNQSKYLFIFVRITHLLVHLCRVTC